MTGRDDGDPQRFVRAAKIGAGEFHAASDGAAFERRKSRSPRLRVDRAAPGVLLPAAGRIKRPHNKPAELRNHE